MDNFFNLTPDRVLAGVESHGFQTTGRYRFLNSYENRVFDIDLENSDTPSLIAKFYRPNRWSESCILEEHQFLWELQEEGLPVAAPLKFKNQQTLFLHDEIYMALFPKVRGRMVEEILPTQVPHLGRWLARLHNIGARKPSTHRPFLQPNIQRLQWVEPYIPVELWTEYRHLAEDVFGYLNSILPDFNFIRVHGDFHRGNLLWNEDWTLIDFDDFLMAPAAQDFWIILSQLEESEQNLFIDSYLELRDWDEQEVLLLEPLRAYRIIHYSTWIGERWHDPSFPQLFPNFREYNFWSNEILSLQKIIHESVDSDSNSL